MQVPRATTHHLVLLNWLRQAGALRGDSGYDIDDDVVADLAGVSRRESDAILGFLYEHCTRQEFLVRYRWESGDLGFWDNRTTQHAVVGDFGDQARVIQRITLRGDEPR